MPSLPVESCFGVAIDTNGYAGSFERQMCAHITGQIGDCGVGAEYIPLGREPLFADDRIISVADEHGCYRPCTMWWTPSHNNYCSVLIFFRDRPTAAEIALIKERAATHLAAWDKNRGLGSKQPYTVITGFRLIEFLIEQKEEPI